MDDLTPEEMQEELLKYRKSLQEEYEVKASVIDPTQIDELETETRVFFRNNVKFAAAQIVWLSQNSSSDSVRFTASKYMLEQAFERSSNENNPVGNILHELAGPNRTA